MKADRAKRAKVEGAIMARGSAEDGVQEAEGEAMKHDHRKSMWMICGGLVLWCRECGAWRNANGGKGWIRPGTQERAMKDLEREEKRRAK